MIGERFNITAVFMTGLRDLFGRVVWARGMEFVGSEFKDATSVASERKNKREEPVKNK
jgi:hypothetical protein